MAIDPLPALDAAELARWFPDQVPPPPDSQFEIGLVLGGTVSSAAYTAGVMSFLFEALDAWTFAKEQANALAPPHDAIIKIIAGTSGGGVTAAMFARFLNFDMPSGRIRPPGLPQANPFYRIWVHDADVGRAHMLDPSDLASGASQWSLLNGQFLEGLANTVVAWSGVPGGPPRPARRSYLAQPLRGAVMLTNLRGIPYAIDYTAQGSARQSFVEHADFIRFAAWFRQAADPAPPAGSFRPDEIALDHGVGAAGLADWQMLRDFALGTSAFPVGLPARKLERPLAHYRYRVTVVPRPGGPEVRPLKVDTAALELADPAPGQPYAFTCVDGGATNNQPVEFVRTALAGMLRRNPQDRLAAQRAVLLVDPFADDPNLSEPSTQSPINVGIDLVGDLVQQSRYATADLVLAVDPDVFSRFLIRPARSDPFAPGQPDWTGTDAIATSKLGAFLGFFWEPYRIHDYQVGRRNCQRFLQQHFTLPGDHRLFRQWTAAQRTAYAVQDPVDGTHLPIIPVMAQGSGDPYEVGVPEHEEPWPNRQFTPSQAFDPSPFRDAIRNRALALFKRLEGDLTANGNLSLKVLVGLAHEIGAGAAARKLADIAIDKIRAEMQRGKL